MLFINLEFKKPAQSVFKEVIAVLKNSELITLFVACLVLGLCNLKYLISAKLIFWF